MPEVNYLELIEKHLESIEANLKRLADIQEPPRPHAWIEGEPPAKDASRQFMGGRWPPLSGNHYHGKPELNREYNSAGAVRPTRKR